MLCVSPAPEIPGWGSHRLSSSYCRCPEPSCCPQSVPLLPTAPTGLASPTVLEHDQTRVPARHRGMNGGTKCCSARLGAGKEPSSPHG